MKDLTQYSSRYKKDMLADHVLYRCSDDALQECAKI